MRKRLQTLVLDANGFAWREVAADTIVLGLLRVPSSEFVPERLRHVRFIRLLRQRYESLGYTADWREALCASPALEVEVCNITNLVAFAGALRRVREFDLVVVLHSAAGDSMSLIDKSMRRLTQRRGRLVVFIGNEYDLMPEKLAFLQATGADYVCSQLPVESARWLYANSGAEVVAMPHALNPDVYRPRAAAGRTADIGFAGALYPLFIGDMERTRLIETVRSRSPKWGLTFDFHERTFPRQEWAELLARCKGTVGAESGTYYLDRRGELIGTAKSFLAAHPTATFDDVYERVFAKPRVGYVSGKCISSRHFEAIGAKSCQILLEGTYNGILEAGTHYIGVRADLADLDEAIARFKDRACRKEIADRAYDYVMDAHTHAHRVRALVDAVGG